MPTTEHRLSVPDTPFNTGDGPSTTAERRARLLRIGSHNNIEHMSSDGNGASSAVSPGLPTTESTELQAGQLNHSYGTLPNAPTANKSAFASRRNFAALSLRMPKRSGFFTNPSSPMFTPSHIRDMAYSRLTAQRPISAYDAPYLSKHAIENDDLDARINGIRVWYSSFTSIDWLHDAIKDSLRFSRLRRRKSLRAKLRLIWDKFLGWLIVTVVGFLTAVIAFLVVRSERWLFDSKEGFCSTSLWKSKIQCCSSPDMDDLRLYTTTEDCEAWHTWAEAFHVEGTAGRAVEYISFAVIALLLSFLSAVLTIYLTNSNTFITRKESGVLAPDFPEPSGGKSTTPSHPARHTMFYAAGSGIPEIKTILSGFVIHGYLGGRVLFTKSVGLALSVASGLSLGKEGPFVHIASAIGNIISRFTIKYETNEAKRREILSAACAAGVAVAFGAPIGGTLFSLEEVSYYFPPKVMWRSFFCAMIAALTLRILDPFGTGKLVLFQVTYEKDWHAYELLSFLLLGVFGGVYGAYFSKLNYRWSKHVREQTLLKTHPISEVLLTTLVTAFLCFLNPYTKMGGTELVYILFSECRTGSGETHGGLCLLDPGSGSQVWGVVNAILVAMIVKGVLTIVTFGIKVPAGIFIPTLGVGACAGRILGILMQYLQYHHPNNAFFSACHGDLDCIIPGLYAMVGAAATLSGVTRTTVSLAVIMFELTDTLTYAVPVMLSVLVAKTVADALEPKGIYDLVIELAQLPYLDAKHEYIWGSLQISDVVDRDVECIQVDKKNTVESLRDLLQQHLSSGNDDCGFPILRPDDHVRGMRLLGYIGSNELEHALSIVADNADEEVHFHNNFNHARMASASFASLIEQTGSGSDPFDFSMFMDSAPLTISSNSPLELLHQFFTKLGSRYVIITDPNGFFEGVIDKKTWLAFLSDLEEK